jgi:prepilin-type N-terminal cleavage/methylation domain-containing protein
MIATISDCLPARRRAANRGFSLIELVVVLGLLGLVVLVGMPALDDWLERYRVRTAAQNLAADMQLQRMRAVSRNRQHRITFSTANSQYTLFESDGGGGWLQLNPLPNSLPQGVTFSSTLGDPVQLAFGGNPDVAIFHPDGSINDRLAMDNPVFLTNIRGEVFRVVINQVTGRVQVLEGEV